MYTITRCYLHEAAYFIAVTEDGKVHDVGLSDLPDVYAVRNIYEKDSKNPNLFPGRMDIIHRKSTCIICFTLSERECDQIVREGFDSMFITFANIAKGLSYTEFKKYIAHTFPWLVDKWNASGPVCDSLKEVRPLQCEEETKKKMDEIMKTLPSVHYNEYVPPPTILTEQPLVLQRGQCLPPTPFGTGQPPYLPPPHNSTGMPVYTSETYPRPTYWDIANMTGNPPPPNRGHNNFW